MKTINKTQNTKKENKKDYLNFILNLVYISGFLTFFTYTIYTAVTNL